MHTRRRSILLACLGLLLPAAVARGQLDDPIGLPGGTLTKVTLQVPPTVRAGESFDLQVVFAIPPGFYIYGPAEKNYVPTGVKVQPADGLTFGEPSFPAPLVEEVPSLGKIAKYKKKLVVKVPAKVAADARADEIKIAVLAAWGTCNDEACKEQFFLDKSPKKLQATTRVVLTRPAVALFRPAVAPGGAFQVVVTFDVPARYHIYGPEKNELGTPTRVELAPVEGVTWGKPRFPPTESKKSPLPDGKPYGIYHGETRVVVDGQVAADAKLGAREVKLALDWGTCDNDACYETASAFPVKLALEISPTGAKTDATKVEPSAGKAGTGVEAAKGQPAGAKKKGRDIGSLLSNPWVVGVFVGFFVLLSLSLFGLYELRLPSGLLEKMETAGGGTGYFGAFGKGLFLGFIAAPCVGPFAASVLGYTATTGNMLIGFLGLFSFGLGLGMLFLFVAIFSGSATKVLPRSGGWMVTLKQHCGFLLLAMGVYFLNNIGKPLLTSLSMAVVLAAWLVFSVAAARRKVLAAAVALPVFVLGGYGFTSWTITGVASTWPPARLVQPPPSSIAWVKDFDQGIAEAKRANKPVFVDFYADWCVPCRQMDFTTFRDSGVLADFAGYVTIKADCTRPTDPGARLKNERWGVKSIPAFALLTADQVQKLPAGELKPDLLLEYFQEPAPLRDALKKVREGRLDAKKGGSFDTALSRGLVWALLFSFGWGVLASLTPCVYPMIPITIGIFAAAEGAGGKLALVSKAVVYVLGIAATYSLLGVVVTAFF